MPEGVLGLEEIQLYTYMKQYSSITIWTVYVYSIILYYKQHTIECMCMLGNINYTKRFYQISIVVSGTIITKTIFITFLQTFDMDHMSRLHFSTLGHSTAIHDQGEAKVSYLNFKHTGRSELHTQREAGSVRLMDVERLENLTDYLDG